jgi:hypothetical protein
LAVAVNLPAFFKTRNGVIAAIGIVILLILAIFAVTWIGAPGIYTGLGLRHDAALEKYLDTLHSAALDQHPQNLTAWSVTWLNSTAAKVNWAFTYVGPGNETNNQTRLILYQESFVMTNFFGTKTASAYVGSINSTYKLMNTTYGSSGAFERAFGHPPSTFAEYKDQAGQGKFIWQFDQFVQVGSLIRTSSA